MVAVNPPLHLAAGCVLSGRRGATHEGKSGRSFAMVAVCACDDADGRISGLDRAGGAHLSVRAADSGYGDWSERRDYLHSRRYPSRAGSLLMSTRLRLPV